MDIAVIIPLFNGSQWIDQTLKSVITQSLLPIEIIVIDDGSEDTSPEIVRSFQGVKLLQNPGKGADQARNFGFSVSRASFVAFLDQDDIWHPAHLKIMGNVLKQYPECPAVISNVCFFTQEDRIIFPTPVINPVEFDVWNYFPINRIPTVGAGLIRREAINSLGGWPTLFGPASDVNFWFRLSANQSLVKNSSITVGLRLHNHSWSAITRRNKNKIYFDFNIEGLKHACKDRTSVKPQDLNLIKDYLLILEHMKKIISAALDFDRGLLEKSSLALEKSLLAESNKFLDYVCQNLLWFLFPQLISGQMQKTNAGLDFLIKTWPKEASRTRKSLLLTIKRILLMWGLLRYLHQVPAKLHQYIVLFILFPLIKILDDESLVFFQ